MNKLGIVDIEIRLIGSEKDVDVREIMRDINKVVFLLDGYKVIHTKVKRGLLWRLKRKFSLKTGD